MWYGIRFKGYFMYNIKEESIINWIFGKYIWIFLEDFLLMIIFFYYLLFYYVLIVCLILYFLVEILNEVKGWMVVLFVICIFDLLGFVNC